MSDHFSMTEIKCHNICTTTCWFRMNKLLRLLVSYSLSVVTSGPSPWQQLQECLLPSSHCFLSSPLAPFIHSLTHGIHVIPLFANCKTLAHTYKKAFQIVETVVGQIPFSPTPKTLIIYPSHRQTLPLETTINLCPQQLYLVCVQ